MSESAILTHPETPFPVGVEYYRAPTPRPEYWDADFARLRAAGFRVLRSASYWNWMEPQPGVYELDDFDRLFDLAEKHGLWVWLDVMLATHGACPEWLTRRHPDIHAVNRRGERIMPDAHAAYAQGAAIHCYDHPAWREHGGALLRYVVNLYKDRPNLLVWGLWDGVGLSSSWTPMGGGYPCYCDSTLARYDAWLRERFTLDALNERLARRYKSWVEVEPPRSNQMVVEMLLYRRFHYENLAGHLKWMADETKKIDPKHETRSHGASLPRPWDEDCAPHVDSWGMSMSSSKLLASDAPKNITDRAFAFDWARSIGRNGRWWNEEIYAGMSPAGVTWKKQSDPRALTMLLWMTLAGGAAGSMFWQYRPEYLSFESPGYNLVALDGEPTARFEAVSEAIQQIDGMGGHLPLSCPKAEVGIVYHQASHELFNYNDEGERFHGDLRSAYTTLWARGIPADILTPRMDWSGYQLLFLPNVALMDDETRERIERTLRESPQTRLVAEGSFGMYSADGQSSYGPPEGFAERLGVRVADVSAVTEDDIAAERNVVDTAHGPVSMSLPYGYAVLEPLGATKAIASLNGDTVGVQDEDGRFTWFGFPLSAASGHTGGGSLALSLAADAGVEAPVAVEGDGVVPVVRRSRLGGRLIFLINTEPRDATVRLRPKWRTGRVDDLLAQTEIPVNDNAFSLQVGGWEVGVVHCAER